MLKEHYCKTFVKIPMVRAKSKWAPVLSVIPQGTVLGPLLISLPLNGISTGIDSEIRLFADDRVCYREIKDTEDTLKLWKDIDQLGCWKRKWGYEISTCQMQYDANNKETDKKNPSYTLERTVLENIESIKYLGDYYHKWLAMEYACQQYLH